VITKYGDTMIVYQLFDQNTHTLIHEELDRGDAEQARGVLEDAVGRRIYICERELDVQALEDCRSA
jgi:hypothetical protein